MVKAEFERQLETPGRDSQVAQMILERWGMWSKCPDVMGWLSLASMLSSEALYQAEELPPYHSERSYCLVDELLLLAKICKQYAAELLPVEGD